LFRLGQQGFALLDFFLGQLKVGYVLRAADNAGAAGSGEKAGKVGMKPPETAIPARGAVNVLAGLAGGNRMGQQFLGDFLIVGMHQLPAYLFADGKFARRRLVQAVQIVRPGQRTFREIELPTPDIGESLALRHEERVFPNLVFGAAAFGYVLQHPGNMRGIAGRVVERVSAALQGADISVREHAAEFAVEHFIAGEGHARPLARPLAILRVHRLPEQVDGGGFERRIEAEIAAVLAGPFDRPGLEIRLEACHAGKLVGLFEQRRASLQVAFGKFSAGDVVRHETQRWRLALTVRQRENANREPAGGLRQRDAIFEAFHAARFPHACR
jgi:hypothetical protein